jgi:SSS family solute:Na+ symporter
MNAHLTLIDVLILVAYIALTTILGARLAGRQATIRDFFLGGRKLPWWGVSGSIVATEISAITLIAVPAFVFAPGGDLTYLQLMLGAVVARVIVALWFVPAFYEREIYSPYDYVGQRLGAGGRSATTALFLLGGVLGQSVRVLMTAVIFQVVLGTPLTVSIWIIGVVAVLWTWLGGITTVIWTDVIQFFVFVLALIVALAVIVAQVPGGWEGVLTYAAAAQPSKLRFWNATLDPTAALTVWTALLANTVLCLNAYGTDQMMAQRMFCCRGPRQAALAILSSTVGLGVTVLAAGVGLGLYAFYQTHPLSPADAAVVAAEKDRIFPTFIVHQLPPGVVGLILAGLAAAAISSLEGALAALSQTVVTGMYQPWRERRLRREAPPPSATQASDDDRHYVRAARLLVVLWAVVLCLMAQVSQLALAKYKDLLNLALAMATYTAGATLAAFLLALLRVRVDARGVIWGAPLSVISVFAISWHARWAQIATSVVVSAVWVLWLVSILRPTIAGGADRRHAALRLSWTDLRATLALATVGTGALVLAWLPLGGTSDAPAYVALAWPWNAPIGFVVAFGLGILVGRPRARHVTQTKPEFITTPAWATAGAPAVVARAAGDAHLAERL